MNDESDLDRIERRIGTSEIIRHLERIDERFERIERVVFVGNGQLSHDRRLTAIEAGQGKVSIAVILAALGSFLAYFTGSHK